MIADSGSDRFVVELGADMTELARVLQQAPRDVDASLAKIGEIGRRLEVFSPDLLARQAVAAGTGTARAFGDAFAPQLTRAITEATRRIPRAFHDAAPDALPVVVTPVVDRAALQAVRREVATAAAPPEVVVPPRPVVPTARGATLATSTSGGTNGPVDADRVLARLREGFAAEGAAAREGLFRGFLDKPGYEAAATEAAEAYNARLIGTLDKFSRQGRLTPELHRSLVGELQETGRKAGDTFADEFLAGGAKIGGLFSVGPVAQLAAAAGAVVGVKALYGGIVNVTQASTDLSTAAKVTGTSLDALQVTARRGQDDFSLSTKQAAGFSSVLTTLAQRAGDAAKAGPLLKAALDLGASRNLTEDQTLGALGGLLKGQAAGLEELVQKKPGAIYQEWANGAHTTAEKLTETQKAQALVHAVLEGGERARGSFAAFLETTPGKVDQLSGNVQTLTERLGHDLAPAFNGVLDVGEGVVKFVSDHGPLVVGLAASAAGVYALAKAFDALTVASVAVEKAGGIRAALKVAYAATGGGAAVLGGAAVFAGGAAIGAVVHAQAEEDKRAAAPGLAAGAAANAAAPEDLARYLADTRAQQARLRQAYADADPAKAPNPEDREGYNERRRQLGDELTFVDALVKAYEGRNAAAKPTTAPPPAPSPKFDPGAVRRQASFENAQESARLGFASAVAGQSPDRADNLDVQIRRLVDAATHAHLGADEIARMTGELRGAAADKLARDGVLLTDQLRDQLVSGSTSAVAAAERALQTFQTTIAHDRTRGLTPDAGVVAAVLRQRVDAVSIAHAADDTGDALKNRQAASANGEPPLVTMGKLLELQDAAQHIVENTAASEAVRAAALSRVVEVQRSVVALQERGAQTAQRAADAQVASLQKIRDGAAALATLPGPLGGIAGGALRGFDGINAIRGIVGQPGGLVDRNASGAPNVLSTVGNVASLIGPVGQAIGGAVQVGSTLLSLGKSLFGAKHDAVVQANTEAVEKLRLSYDTTIKSGGGLASAQRAVSGALAAGFTGKGADLGRYLSESGSSLNFKQIEQIGRDYGVELFNSKGRATADTLSQLRDAFALAAKHVSQFDDTLQGQQTRLDLRTALFDPTHAGTPQVTVANELTLLQSLAPKLGASFAGLSGNTAAGRAAILTELQGLFTKIDTKSLKPDDLGQLTNLDELAGIIRTTNDALRQMADAANAVGSSMLNVATGFKVQAAVFDAQDAHSGTAPTLPGLPAGTAGGGGTAGPGRTDRGGGSIAGGLGAPGDARPYNDFRGAQILQQPDETPGQALDRYIAGKQRAVASRGGNPTKWAEYAGFGA